MAAKWIVGWVGIAALLSGCQDQPAAPAERVDLKGQQFFAADSSELGNHGVNQGSPEVGVPGRRGTAYSFRSPNSWIQVPSNDDLNPRRGSFLVGAWVILDRPPPAGETLDLVRKGLDRSRGGEFALQITADGLVRCIIEDAGHNEATAFGPPVDVADGRWHWVACARTPTYLTAITDDRKVFKQIDTGMVRNEMPLAIGSKYGMEDTAGASRVDEVAYYIARPPETWAQERPPFKRRLNHLQRPERLVGLWRLDETGEG